MEAQTIITDEGQEKVESIATEEKSRTSEPKGSRRIRHAKKNPREALGIIHSAAFRGQKHGLSFALMNLPAQNALGVVIAGSWHCGKCLNFFYGPMPKSEKCPECENK